MGAVLEFCLLYSNPIKRVLLLLTPDYKCDNWGRGKLSNLSNIAQWVSEAPNVHLSSPLPCALVWRSLTTLGVGAMQRRGGEAGT